MSRLTRLSGVRRLCALALLASVAAGWLVGPGHAGEPSRVRPYLVYTTADRARLLAQMREEKEKSFSANQIREWQEWRKGGRFDEGLKTYWENTRSTWMLKLALLTWLDPEDKPSANGGSKSGGSARKNLDWVRDYVKRIQIATGRKGTQMVFPGGENGQGDLSGWGNTLDAGPAMVNYALAFDLLSSPEVTAAGLEPAVLDDMYKRIMDGVFHWLLDHLKTMETEAEKEPNWGWNWHTRQIAGLGMICLAFRDRLEAEPADSTRSKDYKEGLRLSRKLSVLQLFRWSDTGDGDFAYYYEGPHYTKHAYEPFVPFALAHERMYPGDEWKALSLRPDQPLARILRGQTLTVVPTHIDHDTHRPRWTTFPFDDTWLNKEATVDFLPFGLAWIGQVQQERGEKLSDEQQKRLANDKQLFLLACKLIGNAWHLYLMGHPALAEFDRSKTADAESKVPTVMQMKYSGIGIARTGWTSDSLHVALRNVRDIFDEKNLEASMWNHAHADNGQVVAYRSTEVILVDPAYGMNGWGNNDRVKCFTSYDHHNTLLVDDGKGYISEFKKYLEDTRYVLSVYKDRQKHERITRAETVKDAGGDFRVLEAVLPHFRRTVILANENLILIVDRLHKPMNVKACWFGNGTVTAGKTAGNNKQTTDWPVSAELDAGKAAMRYFRGPTFATRIQVLMSTPTETKAVRGLYGPWWWGPDQPTTGIHVTSREPVSFVVTVVEIAKKKDAADQGTFVLVPQATQAQDGSVRVTLGKDAGAPGAVYTVAPDGAVTRGNSAVSAAARIRW